MNWVRLGIAVVVIGCLVYTVVNATQQLATNDFTFKNVRFWPLVLAVLSYIGAMTLSCLFWYRVLLATGNHPGFGQTLLAFFASQLGKYVPGKAMVVVIRTDMIRGERVKTSSAAASVFVETLTWIFVGSVIASLLLIAFFDEFPMLQVTAAVLAIGSGCLTAPPIFRRIATWITSRKIATRSPQSSDQQSGARDVRPPDFSGLRMPVMLFGWVVMAVGWLLNGLSLWLVLASLQETGAQPFAVTWQDYWLALACVTLATVAGFVSLLPGGLGVRELVMIPLLGTKFGAATAIIAAILIRFVWLASELATSGIIYWWRRHPRPPG